MIWQDYLRLSDSHLTCTVETNSLCLFSHEDVYIFQFQQATIFTATILFQPQLITTMYMQLQMIKYINCQFVVLHTCTQTLFHTRHIREMQEIFRSAHNNKKQYFIEPFLIRSVRCTRNHVWWRFLCSPLVLSRLTTAVIVFLSGSCSRYVLKFQIEASTTSILVLDQRSRHAPCKLRPGF